MSDKNLPAAPDVRDRFGNRVLVPDWYEGSVHQFAADIATLEPHHCSYPSGAVQAVDKARPCRGRKLPGQLYCKDHLAMAVPKIHTDKLSREQQKELGDAIADSNLLDPSVNVFYADVALARQAQKCNDGGLSARLAKSLGEAAASLRGISADCQKKWDYIGDLREKIRLAERSNVDPEEINRIRDKIIDAQKSWQRSYDKMLTMHERFEKIASIAARDEENWRELREYNDHSVNTKAGAVKVMHGRQGFMAIEESRRALFALAEHMQTALIEMVDRQTAEVVMRLIYQRFQEPSATTELAGYRSMKDET